MVGSRLFTREDEDRLIAQYLEGASLMMLGEQEGCSSGAVRKVLVRRGIQRRPRAQKCFTPEDEDRLVGQYLEGAPLHRLAKQEGCHLETVRQVLLRRGVERRSPRTCFTREDEDRVIVQYLEGASLSELAAQEKCTSGAVRKMLVRLGVTRRPRGNAGYNLDADQQRQLVADYEAGMDQIPLAKKYCVNQKYVSRCLRSAGVRVRLQGAAAEGFARCGGRIMVGGYVVILVPADSPFASMRREPMGYVPEHRLVMAQYLGRPLRPTETVHHRDGDRTNNELANLELRQGAHGKGVRVRCACCGSFDIETF